MEAIFGSGIMYISHVFLLSTIFDSHLLFISAAPLRSFSYLLPSFNKDYLLMETKSLKCGMYGVFVRSLHLIHLFMKAWTFL